MSTFDTRFESKGVDYTTPGKLWQPLMDEFCFVLDAAASHDNAKCLHYYTEETDGLNQPWFTYTWVNPPFGMQLSKWVKKAHTENQERGTGVVMLLPIRSNTKYWREHILHGNADEIRWVDWSPSFNGEKGFSTPLAIIVWAAR